LRNERTIFAGTTYTISSDDESSEEEKEVYHTVAQVLEPPLHDSPRGASWRWRALPWMSFFHCSSCGCLLSDGRFAVFGALDVSIGTISSCKLLSLDADGGRWDTFSPMRRRCCGRWTPTWPAATRYVTEGLCRAACSRSAPARQWMDRVSTF